MDATTALYAFSADPITFGHINIVERAARVFGHVIVGIGRNPAKKYLFSLEERLGLATLALARLPNVSVKAFRGMVVDFASEQGAKVIVKGVRNAADFDYEQVMHQVGISQKAGIDTHVLFADPALAHVSSSAVKAIQLEHGFIHDYVPLGVKAALEEKLAGQLVIGVTGVAGAGKSTLCDQLVDEGAARGIDIHNVDLDAIAHRILSDLHAPLFRTTRDELAARFGPDIATAAGIDRKKLAARVFGNTQALADLNAIMRTPLTVALRQAMYGLRGIVLINGALLAEAGLLPLCNNRIVLADPGSRQEQTVRLAARGHRPDEIAERIDVQWRSEEKADAIAAAIATSGFGRMWRWNTGGHPTQHDAARLLDDILAATGFAGSREAQPHAA